MRQHIKYTRYTPGQDTQLPTAILDSLGQCGSIPITCSSSTAYDTAGAVADPNRPHPLGRALLSTLRICHPGLPSMPQLNPATVSKQHGRCLLMAPQSVPHAPTQRSALCCQLPASGSVGSMPPQWCARRRASRPLNAVGFQHPASSCQQRQLHTSSMERAATRFTRRLYSRLSAVNRRAASAFAGLCSACTDHTCTAPLIAPQPLSYLLKIMCVTCFMCVTCGHILKQELCHKTSMSCWWALLM